MTKSDLISRADEVGRLVPRKGRKENQVDEKTASEVYVLIKMGIAVQYGFVSEEEAIETYKKLIEEEEDEGNGGDEYDEE